MNDGDAPAVPADALLATPRLILRRWRDEDLEPFAALNADGAVMEHVPARLTGAESDRLVERIEAHFAAHGYGLYVVELREQPGLLGFVGLQEVRFEAPFTPATEIGWRLARNAWGRGIATEAARAVVDHAFSALGKAELVSFTIPENARSRALMERIGMTRQPADDFDHPRVPTDSPLSRHVLYRLRASSSSSNSSSG